MEGKAANRTFGGAMGIALSGVAGLICGIPSMVIDGNPLGLLIGLVLGAISIPFSVRSAKAYKKFNFLSGDLKTKEAQKVKGLLFHAFGREK